MKKLIDGPLCVAFALLCVLGAGCTSTRQIETSPPRVHTDADEQDPEALLQARLIVTIQEGMTNLPDDVAHLQFRITDVQLHDVGGEWLRLPSDGSVIQLDRNGVRPARTVLDTRVPPERYDSLAVSFDRVFVRFNENAGAPLTTAKDVPQKLALSLAPTLDAPTALALFLEPAASLSRTPDCRWFFVPMLRPEIAENRESSRRRSD